MKRQTLNAGLLTLAGLTLGGCPLLNEPPPTEKVNLSDFVASVFEQTNDCSEPIDISKLDFIDDEQAAIYNDLIERFGS